jgi:hypothetical protein
LLEGVFDFENAMAIIKGEVKRNSVCLNSCSYGFHSSEILIPHINVKLEAWFNAYLLAELPNAQIAINKFAISNDVPIGMMLKDHYVVYLEANTSRIVHILLEQRPFPTQLVVPSARVNRNTIFVRASTVVPTANPKRLTVASESVDSRGMGDLCRLTWCAVVGLFRSRASLQAEILVLRHQLNVLQRKASKRVVLGNVDRLAFVGLYRLVPEILGALNETVIRWHRMGFRAYWRWKSRPRGRRPQTPADIRRLIREMSVDNPLWGAPRIHSELLKLGIDAGQTTVAKYMAKRRRPPSQVEDVSSQSCRWHRVDGPVRRPDDLVPVIVRTLILRHWRREFCG